MTKDSRQDPKPLIIYLDDDGNTRKTYSDYEIVKEVIIFYTKTNKITLPLKNLIKIKENKRGLRQENGFRDTDT